jgi:hypothetical protein
MPRWSDLKRFCLNDGWVLYKQTDHYYFRKVMENGVIKRTKVSMGSKEIKRYLWQKILKQQLQVTEEYFNRMK